MTLCVLIEYAYVKFIGYCCKVLPCMRYVYIVYTICIRFDLCSRIKTFHFKIPNCFKCFRLHYNCAWNNKLN